ncbi:unnamed protein product [marine sediment metagenome]|uniref:Uncharacterized protein n=1 Tax=marine sediment metagenome TaxID=412755 RepID=X1LAG8_9ZZZZ
MHYSFPLLIPANTLESAPVETTIALTWGVITHVTVRFPPRCVALAKVAILHHRHQVWPTNIDAWWYGNDEVVGGDEYYEVFEMPAYFTLIGYNDDDTYPHTPIIRINILPPLIAMAKYGGFSQYPQIRQYPWEET